MERAESERFMLLVEDNPDDEELTLRALERHNLANEVVVVRDGAEALDFLLGRGDFAGRDTDHQPEVVLLDLNLPRIDGFQVLQEMRSNDITRYLPVVVLTTSSRDRDVIESYRLGANSFVSKPVKFGDFVEAVKQLGVYWLALNRRTT